MSSHAQERQRLASTRRVVVKIGSRSLARTSELYAALAEQVAELSATGRSVVIVSSGAIALGCERLGYSARPAEMAKLQAAAAAGQGLLMKRWDRALADVGLTVAQVLLTHADLADRERSNNARGALAELVEVGAVPVVNENDTVATDEIRFGDNDQLASMVTPLVGADLLVLLTDVEGVLDDAGERIAHMTEHARPGSLAPRGEQLGSGGIASKIDAAGKATRAGAAVVIASATRPHVLRDIVAGEDVGTLFSPSATALKARKHWIAYTLRPRGDVLLDPGAARAVRDGKSSLLPVGVLGVRGDFHAGDAVRLVTAEGAEVARGLARMSAVDIARSAGKKGDALELVFGATSKGLVVVHKDDMVGTV